MHEPGQEIIHLVVVSNHPCHYEAIKVLPGIALNHRDKERYRIGFRELILSDRAFILPLLSAHVQIKSLVTSCGCLPKSTTRS